MAKESTKTIAYALYESLKNVHGKDAEVLLSESVKFLVKRNLLSKSDEILSHLQDKIDEEEGIIRARVTSAHKLTRNTLDEIKEKLKKRYKAEHVEIDTQENEKLIGGVKIQVKDEVIDQTLSHKLELLQTHLIAH